MINFREWRKKNVAKNQSIDKLLQAISDLKLDVEELDSLEKKSKPFSLKIKNDIKGKEDEDMADSDIDVAVDRDDQSVRRPSDDKISTISPRTGGKPSRSLDSEKRSLERRPFREN